MLWIINWKLQRLLESYELFGCDQIKFLDVIPKHFTVNRNTFRQMKQLTIQYAS